MAKMTKIALSPNVAKVAELNTIPKNASVTNMSGLAQLTRVSKVSRVAKLVTMLENVRSTKMARNAKESRRARLVITASMVLQATKPRMIKWSVD